MAQFENAVGYIPQTSKQFYQDPFTVGANAFVPLNRGLSYQKNLLGLWADADTQQSKVAATNAINNFKVAENEIGTRRLRGIDEAIAAQMGLVLNQDGTFKPIEDASQQASFNVNNPYARAFLYDAALKGSANTAAREAWLNPVNSLNSQQGYGTLPRGITVNEMGDGKFQVSNGAGDVYGTFTREELSSILSGVGGANKVGATQLSFNDFTNRAGVKYDYDVKLSNLKHQWDLEVAQAQSQGKAVSAELQNRQKAIEALNKFAVDGGLLAAATSGDETAIRQLQGYTAYTESAFGLQPGSLTSVLFAPDPGNKVDVDVNKVGEAFKTQAIQQPLVPKAAVPNNSRGTYVQPYQALYQGGNFQTYNPHVGNPFMVGGPK